MELVHAGEGSYEFDIRTDVLFLFLIFIIFFNFTSPTPKYIKSTYYYLSKKCNKVDFIISSEIVGIYKAN